MRAYCPKDLGTTIPHDFLVESQPCQRDTGTFANTWMEFTFAAYASSAPS